MQSSSSKLVTDADYPPLAKTGPPEDSDLAQRNFAERERLTKSWRARLFSRRNPDLSLLERRSHVYAFDSTSSSSNVSLDDAPQLAPPSTPPTVLPAGPHRSESFTDTGGISVNDPDEDDPSKNKHLYRWAMVYENQRGISIFSTRRYSSQSLLPRDPPSFSIAAPDSSSINGRPVRKSLRPDVSLEHFPLPDGNWRWASKEWMVDMRDETVQYDGFEYNWFFRTKGWRSNAGRFNAGAWVRRRRWLRLMERPPLGTLKEEDSIHVFKHSEMDSIDLDNVWRGDNGDWSRLHHALHKLDRDGRKLDAWKGWIKTAKWITTTEDTSSGPTPESMSKVIRAHVDELLRSFVYPSSRIEFLQTITESGLLSEAEVLGTSASNPSYVDRTRLEDALSAVKSS